MILYCHICYLCVSHDIVCMKYACLLQVSHALTMSEVMADTELKKRRMRLELLDEMRVASTSTPADTPSDVAMEVANYLTMRYTGVDDTMEFWRRHVGTMLTLSKFAALYLSMSSSSVPVERMFSTTGLLSNYATKWMLHFIVVVIV